MSDRSRAKSGASGDSASGSPRGQAPGKSKDKEKKDADKKDASDTIVVDSNGPAWLEETFPWLISLTFNLGIFLTGVFIAYLSAQSTSGKDGEAIIIPNSFEDPALSEHPGGVPNVGTNDPMRQTAQERLKEMAKTEGWAQSDSPQNLANLLGGQAGDLEASGIFAGSGGSLGGETGNGSGAGKVAAYGAPGGGGVGPKSAFYGTGGNATKIVYILDSSGSMLDNFTFLKNEAMRSVNNLVPLQFYAVVLVSDRVISIGPNQLQRAVPEAKKQFAEQLGKQNAAGQNDDLLVPFQGAFERAFAMKPELIYFLTDGHFDDGLIKIVNQLNRDKKVHINTLAFVTEEPAYKAQLEALARENGGVYKFIPERELGR